MYIFDSHVHTKYSFDAAKDGSSEISAILDAAISAGVMEISLTDHCDIDGIYNQIYPPFPAKEIKADILSVRERYEGKIRVNFGIELGQPHVRVNEANALLDEMGYDFVIGSLHNLRDYPDFAQLRYEYIDDMQLTYLMRRSFLEFEEIISFGRIATLAHITYIQRYLSEYGREFDLKPWRDDYAALFKKLITSGIALECNTSGLRRGGITMPGKELFALYRECGGERITLGSDAHTARDVGNGIEEAAAMLRSLGFRSQTVMRNGVLTEIEL